MAQDLPALVQLENRVFIPSDGMLTQRSFRYHMRTNNLFLVAKEDDSSTEVMGYILVFVRRLSVRIYSIATNPAYQRRGVARALLEHVLKETIALNIYNVKLELRETNKSALKLYESLGFKQKLVRRNYYGDNESAIFMQWCYGNQL